MEYFIGVDIGGTNTRLGLVGTGGEVLAIQRFPTRDYPQVEAFVQAMID